MFCVDLGDSGTSLEKKVDLKYETLPQGRGKLVKEECLVLFDLRLRYFILFFLFLWGIPVSAYNYEVTWRFENHGNEVYNMSLKDLGIPVFPDTGFQRVIMETSYNETKLLRLEPGFVKIIPVDPVLVPIYEGYTIHASYKIESTTKPTPSIGKQMAESVEQIPEELLEYTVSNSLYPGDNPEITDLAAGLTLNEETVYGKVQCLLDWFEENSTYIITETPKRPEYMIRDPRGDCDDLSLLFISMCRSQGIPAYLQAGVVFSDSIRIDKTDWNGHYHYVFEGAGWHAWVMVYIPPWGWLPVDLTMLGGMNPVETITEAYYWRKNTITAWNITSHDYIHDEINQRKKLNEANVIFTQVDKLVIEEEKRPLIHLYWGAAALILLVYLKIRD